MTDYDPDIVGEAIVDSIDHALAPVRTTVVELRARVDELRDRLREIEGVRERLAAAEARPPIPGPPGPAGTDGKDGADGIGFDDLSVEYDHDRTIVLRFARGATVKTFPISLPFLKYCGVHIDGRIYVAGDVVTLAGSAWTCTATATQQRPGEGVSGWQLMVKRGADARR